MKLHHILFLLTIGSLGSSSWATVWTVNASGTSFAPQNLTIQLCDTVVWENTEGFHNVHETGSNLFYSGDPADAPWVYQFAFRNVAPGIYNYQCDVHFDMGMTGTITVLALNPQLHLVNASGHAFTPANITITQGDTVRWHNSGGTHNVHELGSNLFNSGAPSGTAWTYTFVFNNVSTGVYNYHCDVHFGSGMVGTVTVEADTCPTPADLAPPEQLTIFPSGNDAILNWSPVAGATSYTVYASSVGTEAEFPLNLGSTPSTTFTDVGILNSEELRFYHVRATAL